MAKLQLKNHIILTSGQDIAVICEPIKKYFGITSFNYVRTYDDGSQVNLANIPEWLEHFYTNEFHMIGAFEKHPKNYESGFALWPSLSGQRVFYDARTYFNIDNGITIIEKLEDSCEFYYFGTTTNNHNIINFYLNNIDLLKRFILYFKEKAAPILKKANQNRIVIPDHFNKFENEDRVISVDERLKKKFLEETAIKRFQLHGELEGQHLSYKQLNCIINLIEGRTAKEIAKILNVSPRTVEGHINKLKVRFDCHTKSALVSKILKSGLGLYSGRCNVLA